MPGPVDPLVETLDRTSRLRAVHDGLACAYATEYSELAAPLATLWEDPRLTGVERGGSLLWLAI